MALHEGEKNPDDDRMWEVLLPVKCRKGEKDREQMLPEGIIWKDEE